MEKTVTPEGWTVEDAAFYRWCVDYPAPRPRAFSRQLWEDATSWKPLALWTVGFGFIALSAVTRYWFLIVPGVLAFHAWFRMFRSVARYFRDAPLVIGRITALSSHPVLTNISTGEAALPDGSCAGVVLPTLPGSDMLKSHGSIETLLLYDPDAQFSIVIGVRGASC